MFIELMVYIPYYFPNDYTSCINHPSVGQDKQPLLSNCCNVYSKICRLKLHSCCYLCFWSACFYCLHIINSRILCHFVHGLYISRTFYTENMDHAYNSLCLQIIDYGYGFLIEEFEIELLLIQLYLSFVFSNL